MEAFDINDFESIRPYHDEEVPAAIAVLSQNERFFEMMAWVYPNLDRDDILEMLAEIKTIDDFQQNLSGPAFKVVTQMTTSGLTFSQIDQIKPDEAYLFLSNHRDIILDSALLNVTLLEKGLKTTQIAIGDNLLMHPMIRNIVRLNKNFIVNRNVNPKEMLLYSQRLSNYIRKTITEEKVSIWIAHREGRSKDGDDRTANGLLKMLSMVGEQSIEEKFKSLNILPTAVSYEYDPCDIFKVNELITLKLEGSYEKEAGEDYKSMLKGLTGHKGRVHIAVGSLLNEEIDQLEAIQNKNDKIRHLAQVVDRQMHEIYRLWPTNYIAYDLLNGTRRFAHKYTNLEKFAFRNYITGRVISFFLARASLVTQKEGIRKQVRELFLQMYANPVINRVEADRYNDGELSSVRQDDLA